ncbi:MAG: carbohydrate binding domain-containing protein [Pyrinomonadaceae bacterium]|nr:carbohydrate binding domain-containing protein [Pyrinomonadaceae bacterium]
MSIKKFQLNSPLSKVLLIIIGLVLVLIFFYFGKWSFANAMTTQATVKEISEIAIDLAPNDPQTHYSLGILAEKSLLPDDYEKSVKAFEKAVSLSPNDYRLWLALGKARERNDDQKGAENALRKALELAPNYSQTRWILGNILLRQGKSDEAFSEIRKAVDSDSTLAMPAATTAWNVFNGDVPTISSKIGDSLGVKAALAIFLAKQERYTEAMEFWNSLPKEEKRTTYQKNAKELINALLNVKKFRSALQIQTETAETDAEIAKIGQITNGSFEKNVDPKSISNFDWKIGEGTQTQFGFDDTTKNDGSRSLALVINSNTAQDFRSFSQNVAVESGKAYKFKGFVRADLKGTASAKIEISDATNGKILATTANILNNSNDWQELSANFTMPENSEGITIKLIKSNCNSVTCQLSGKLWLDNFILE